MLNTLLSSLRKSSLKNGQETNILIAVDFGCMLRISGGESDELTNYGIMRYLFFSGEEEGKRNSLTHLVQLLQFHSPHLAC